jgi:O-antigen/teichoic acid export membrane protein
MAAGSAAILLAGRPFIRWWTLGEVDPGHVLLAVLGVYFTLWMWSWVNGNLFQALGGIGQRSIVIIVNAVINLSLSIALVRRWGPVGVSVGSLVALACTEAVVVPLLLRRRLRRLREESSATRSAVEAGDGAPAPLVQPT